MTIYSELLRAAVESVPPDGPSMSDRDLIALWRRRRDELDGEPAPSPGPARPVSARIGDLLSCDVLLIEICQRLGIEQRLIDPGAGPLERARVQRAVEAVG